MKRYYCILSSLLTLLLTACSSDPAEEPIPDGMGRVRMIITCNPTDTRGATGNWLNPTADVERIQKYTVVFAQGNEEKQRITSASTTLNTERDEFEFFLAPGTYTVYAYANIDNVPTGVPADNATLPVNTTNGWTGNIPMTGKQTVNVVAGENQPFAIEVVRTMAKLQFDIKNTASQPVQILGYEVSPLTTSGTSIPLFPPDVPPLSSLLSPLSSEVSSVLAVNGTTTLTAYINETNASATAVANQFSVRFKLRRAKVANPSVNNDADWEADEYRFGFTTNTADGFTYIYRNDWIKIPITLQDWQFRVELMPFTPIAGFAAYMGSADALTTQFNSGGYICMQPLFRNNAPEASGGDPAGVWNGLDDSRIIFKMPSTYTDISATRTEALITDTSDPAYNTGLILEGDLDIFTDRFQRIGSTETIVANLHQTNLGTVTVTIRVKLKKNNTDPGGFYEFSHNIVR